MCADEGWGAGGGGTCGIDGGAMALRIGSVFGAGCNERALGFSSTGAEVGDEDGMTGHW